MILSPDAAEEASGPRRSSRRTRSCVGAFQVPPTRGRPATHITLEQVARTYYRPPTRSRSSGSSSRSSRDGPRPGLESAARATGRRPPSGSSPSTVVLDQGRLQHPSPGNGPSIGYPGDHDQHRQHGRHRGRPVPPRQGRYARWAGSETGARAFEASARPRRSSTRVVFLQTRSTAQTAGRFSPVSPWYDRKPCRLSPGARPSRRRGRLVARESGVKRRPFPVKLLVEASSQTERLGQVDPGDGPARRGSPSRVEPSEFHDRARPAATRGDFDAFQIGWSGAHRPGRQPLQPAAEAKGPAELRGRGESIGRQATRKRGARPPASDQRKAILTGGVICDPLLRDRQHDLPLPRQAVHRVAQRCVRRRGPGRTALPRVMFRRPSAVAAEHGRLSAAAAAGASLIVLPRREACFVFAGRGVPLAGRPPHSHSRGEGPEARRALTAIRAKYELDKPVPVQLRALARPTWVRGDPRYPPQRHRG